MKHILIYLLVAAVLFSCAMPRVQQNSSIAQHPHLTPDHIVMEDGYVLPLTTWHPEAELQAIVLALHGFNDYRNAFTDVAPALSAAGILVYAYDQRGFGETDQHGIWPGSERLQQDAALVSELLCMTHPRLPFYLVGESMGGAVAMTMLENTPESCVEGVVLVAPAVWGWRSMPLWQQSALWLAAHTWPGKKLTGSGLGIRASDNLEMLRAQGRNPLVIKETRVDSMYGLTGLMEDALLSSSQLAIPALILYGELDEIIPAKPVCEMFSTLPAQQPDNWRLALYPDGYHMLTRDLQAGLVLDDMVAWLLDRHGGLPAGFEVKTDAERVKVLCGDL